ncbi:MAG: iron ABC transporter permease [Deltaproteobacteria bacterium]|nr:iron ABC transporter permease [Deltaproteobacteria bacterium]
MPTAGTQTIAGARTGRWPGLKSWEPSLPVWLGAAAFLVCLMVFPLGAIFKASLWAESGFNFHNYVEVFTHGPYLAAILNTVVISLWVGLISVVIGGLLAWLVTRTDLPWKKTIRALVMASFVTPPFLGAFAWTLLAGPNAGLLNKLYRSMTGSEEALFNVFTMSGLILVMALYSFPYVFSMIANVCELISSDLEDAAVILGARKLRTAWTITLPLALPALVGGFIVAFLQSLSHPYNYHPDLDLLSVPAATRSRGRLFGAAADRDHGADRVAEKNSRPARIQHRRRKRRTEEARAAWLGQAAGAPVRNMSSRSFGVSALLDSLEGRAFQGLGATA